VTPKEKQEWRERHDAELERRRLAKAAEKEQRRGEVQLARTETSRYDAHTLAMAASYHNEDGTIGIPVEEFVRRMDERRAHMRLLPPIADQLATAPSINPVKR
jgi:hypothetical protein